MYIEELKERLDKIGVTVSEKTLRRWGDNGFIENHQKNIARTGRGNAEEWSEKAYTEAAAVWAIFSRKRDRNGKASYGTRGRIRQVSKELVDEIKNAVERVYNYPAAFYEAPQGLTLTGPDPDPSASFSWRRWKMKVVKDSGLNELVEEWIVASEKAKATVYITKPKKVVFHWVSIRSPEKANKDTTDILFDEVSNEVGMDSLNEEEQHELRDKFLQEFIDEVGADRLRDLINDGLEVRPNGADVSAESPLSHKPEKTPFDLERVSLEDFEDGDEARFVFLLDGTDSRKKAMYAPFDPYDPRVQYGWTGFQRGRWITIQMGG